MNDENRRCQLHHGERKHRNVGFYRLFSLVYFYEYITIKNCLVFFPAALNYMKGYPRSINYGKGTLIHVLLLLTLATESFTAVVIITSNVYHV